MKKNAFHLQNFNETQHTSFKKNRAYLFIINIKTIINQYVD